MMKNKHVRITLFYCQSDAWGVAERGPSLEIARNGGEKISERTLRNLFEAFVKTSFVVVVVVVFIG